MLQVEKISSQILVAEFQSNPKKIVISCYCPHNARPEEDADTFYHGLRSVLSRVPAHNFLSLLGDFNARLGPEDALFTYNLETNRNGEKLVDFMEEFNLVASNTRFMKLLCKLWSFEYPNGQRAQLDYFVVRNKWINSVRDSQAYLSFCSVHSDHRIVSIKIIFKSPLFQGPQTAPHEADRLAPSV